MAVQPVLIGGTWRQARHSATFQAGNPATAKPLPDIYPVSHWEDCDAALTAAIKAADALVQLPSQRLATFLERFAERISARGDELVETAHAETALPKKPRLAEVELPRTTSQLRQAAAAAREGSWALPTIDTKFNIRSCYLPLGPIAVFGPNNFPFAFNSASGGDFAAAIASGNPVIAKANSSHPATTRLLAEEAHRALLDTELPPATVQLIYRTSHADGERFVADHRLGGTGYTGSRAAGLALKRAADAAGKPIYLELSSINPVIVLPGALAERGEKIAEEFTGSCLMGTGQFCTNPGLVLLLAGQASESFVDSVAHRFRGAGGRSSVRGRCQESPARSRRAAASWRRGPGRRHARLDRRISICQHAAASLRPALPQRSGQIPDRGIRQCVAVRRRARRRGGCTRARSPGRQPHRLHLLGYARSGRQIV